MCGVFFVVERGRPVDLPRALRATEALRHRGPDGTGHYRFERSYGAPQGPVRVAGFAGHTRLSILDTSDASSQPFRRGDRTLTYNGEIYNFRALREELARAGTAFETEGDTEVLMALLAAGGVEALGRANGMWAFCLLDEAAGTLTAVRDRYGKKPLFYYADARTFCCASEIAPILLYLGRQPGLEADALDTYLREGWLFPRSDGRTHMQGIRQVLAGGALHVDLAQWSWREDRYFDLARDAGASPPHPDDLTALVEDAVLSRLVADRRVGLLLSGGVDSSLILSVLHARGLADRITCFTGDAGKSDDARYARMCVQQLGIQAIDVTMDYGPSSMDAFLQVCRHQEKPFPFIGNALAMPQLYARIAQHDVPVVLDGTGGDEVFAGYWYRQYRFALAEALAAGRQPWIEESLAANADDPDMRLLTRRALDLALSGGTGGPRPAMRCEADDPGDMASFMAGAREAAPAQDVLEGFQGSLGSALLADAREGRLHEWLWQNDRNAMACGIENRSPLLDHRLAGWMHSGYARKFVGPWNKHELRLLFSAFTPLPTQWRRHKQGFRWVYGRFLRSNQAQVLELIASSTVLRGCVDVGRLLDAARASQAHLHSSLVHRMLCIAGLEQTMGLALTQ